MSKYGIRVPAPTHDGKIQPPAECDVLDPELRPVTLRAATAAQLEANVAEKLQQGFSLPCAPGTPPAAPAEAASSSDDPASS